MPVIADKSTLFGVLIVLLLAHTALAEGEDVIARCAQIASVGDRILCLENALRQAPPEIDNGPQNEEAVRLRETVILSDDIQPNIAVNQLTDVSLDSVGTEADSTPTSDATPQSDDFGLKDQRPSKETATMRVTVISVRKNLNRRYIFETADGHTWLQTDQRTVRLADTPFTAEIRPASMGSFFLKPASGGVSIRVRREK